MTLARPPDARAPWGQLHAAATGNDACRHLAELRRAPSMRQTLGNPCWGTNSTGAGTARPRGRCRPSEIGRKSAAALFRTLGTDWVLGLKDMQGPVRTRESAQDLSWLCSLPCGNSGTAPSTASRSKPSSASPHRRLHEDGCAELRRAPC